MLNVRQLRPRVADAARAADGDTAGGGGGSLPDRILHKGRGQG